MTYDFAYDKSNPRGDRKIMGFPCYQAISQRVHPDPEGIYVMLARLLVLGFNYDRNGPPLM